MTTPLPKPERQQRYVDELKARGSRLPLVNTEVFIESVRDSGYKSTATALDELVDNAYEADATRVDVVLGYAPDAGSTKKLNDGGMIAVADNGHGMKPEVIRLSVMWGGTHRHDSRTGFGRYGFGLPSAASSIARRFSVYSRTVGQPWHRVHVDIDAIARHQFTDKDGIVVTPPAEPAAPPAWVLDSAGPLDSGTVVVLDGLDRLSTGYIQSSSFRRKLLNHLGLVYRGILRETTLSVTDTAVGTTTEVAPVDPLFLTPSARFYDENEVQAEAFPDARFVVSIPSSGSDPNNHEKRTGAVRVRFSYMPPGFQGETQAESKKSARYAIMKANNGILVLRAGRQIDVVRTVPDDWGYSIGQVYDRNWGCEIDFEPTLDAEFGITTNKQQATLSERMWDILDNEGVAASILQLRRRYATEIRQRKEERERKRETEWRQKISERVAQKAAKFKTRRPELDRLIDDGSATPQRDDAPDPEAQLRDEAARQAAATGRAPQEVLDDMMKGGYLIEYEKLPGAPPYRAMRHGGQVKLLINQEHRLFRDVYAADWLPAQARTALELFLIVLADSEIDAQKDPDRRRFYESERSVWGQKLNTMLDILDEEDPEYDAASALAADLG